MSKEDKQPVDDNDSDDEEVPALEEKGADQKVEEVEDTTLGNSDVVTKYQEAARIVQAALIQITSLCVAGAKLLDICKAGDTFITEKTNAVYKTKGKNGKLIEKGIAFPVCISVNEYVCHYSPLTTEDKLPPLVDGDLVKIDIGAHIDGYIAVGAHTAIVGPVVVPAADSPPAALAQHSARNSVLAAAWTAAEACVQLIKPGASNTSVTEMIKKITDHYGVKCMSNMQMNQMKRYVIDGKKAIQLRDDDQRIESCTFDKLEVYCIDISVSSGEGKPKQTDLRTTVYKRNVDVKYGLKVKASRQFFNDVNRKFPTMPFSLRYLESGDEAVKQLGVRECVNNNLLTPYPVLSEKLGTQIAHVKFTILLMPGGNVKVTGLDFPAGFTRESSNGPLPEEIAKLFEVDEAAIAAQKKKDKKKAARKKKTTTGGKDEADD